MGNVAIKQAIGRKTKTAQKGSDKNFESLNRRVTELEKKTAEQIFLLEKTVEELKRQVNNLKKRN